MTITVDMEEAKTQLSNLVMSVSKGDTVIIASGGVPVARLEPVEKNTKRQLGFVKCTLPESFFDPLPEEELTAWGL
jgi:prevent-host-death family protein